MFWMDSDLKKNLRMQISTLLSCAFRNLRVDWCKSSRVTCSKWVSSVGFSIFFPPCCTAPLKFKFTFHKVPRRPWLCPYACAFEIHWLAAVQTLRAIGYPHGRLFFCCLSDRQTYSTANTLPRNRASCGHLNLYVESRELARRLYITSFFVHVCRGRKPNNTVYIREARKYILIEVKTAR